MSYRIIYVIWCNAICVCMHACVYLCVCICVSVWSYGKVVAGVDSTFSKNRLVQFGQDGHYLRWLMKWFPHNLTRHTPRAIGIYSREELCQLAHAQATMCHCHRPLFDDNYAGDMDTPTGNLFYPQITFISRPQQELNFEGFLTFDLL